MNAVIKLSSIEYLQVLEELLFSKIHPKDAKISPVKLPLYNFISILVTIYSQYTTQNTINSLSLFILHYFVVIHSLSKLTMTLVLKVIDRCMAWSACGGNMLIIMEKHVCSSQCWVPKEIAETMLKCSCVSGKRSWGRSDPSWCKKSSWLTVFINLFRGRDNLSSHSIRCLDEKLHVKEDPWIIFFLEKESQQQHKVEKLLHRINGAVVC